MKIFNLPFEHVKKGYKLSEKLEENFAGQNQDLYSNVTNLIKKCFVKNVNQRITSENLKIEIESIKSQLMSKFNLTIK